MKNISEDLVYPELSFKIVGCAFEVYNKLGFGHAEKYYQKALSIELTDKKSRLRNRSIFH